MKVRALIVAGVVGLGLPSAGVLVAPDAGATADPCPGGTYLAQALPYPSICTFTYSGDEATFTVPAGATHIEIGAFGGAGGDGALGNDFGEGGTGALVDALLPVTAGTTLYVEVGGNGSDGAFHGGPAAGGFNGGADSGTEFASWRAGGGGGGASDVRSVSRTSPGTLESRVVVAAGGGGGGGGGVGVDELSGDGGTGGGGDGGDALAPSSPGDAIGKGGHGGTATEGGAGGAAPTAGSECFEGDTPSRVGADGSSGSGGAGGCGDGGSGGGGGGGYYGGGGGGGSDDGKPGSGGGGGSNFFAGSAQYLGEGTNDDGVPKILILWFVYPADVDGDDPCTNGTETEEDLGYAVQHTCTYGYTGEQTSFVTPTGVTDVLITATGGKGGSGRGLCGFGGTGGGGAEGAGAGGHAPVTSGDELVVRVGGNGGDVEACGASTAGGWNGGGAGGDNAGGSGAGAGGGGGASEVRTDENGVLVIAGGGGGGGGGVGTEGGFGGYGGGYPGFSGPTVFGGSVSGQGGGGGGASAGGAGGTSGCDGDGESGTAGSGGTGAAMCGADGAAGGGGGGGAFGGGGGGAGTGLAGGGGGGGGSNAFGPTITGGGSGIASADEGSVAIIWLTAAGSGSGDDTLPPIVDVSFPDANADGWYAELPVVGTVTADDSITGGSTITSIDCTGATVGDITGLGTSSASAPLTVSAEGEPEVSCTATDSSANTGDDAATVHVDVTDPVITPDSHGYVAGTPTTDPVTVDFECGDALSGVDIDTLAGDTISEPTNDGSITSTGTCQDNAGNSADPYTFEPIIITSGGGEGVAPVIEADSNGYVAGTWTNAAVTVDFTCTDVDGDIVTDTVAGDTLSTDTSNGSITNTGSCTDAQGHTAAPVTFDQIMIDTTKPIISSAATKADTTTYTADTWTNQTVSVAFTCAEAGAVQSGLDTNALTGGSVSADTSTGSVTNGGSCVDNAGNSALAVTFSPIKVDTTQPTVTPSLVSAPADGFLAATTFGSGATYPVTVGASPINTGGTASDGGSGLASVTVNGTAATGTTSWSRNGVALATSGSTATVVVTDQAGNTRTVVLATLQRDIDGDGIANNIDGDSSVNPAIGQATFDSTRFSDKKLAGITSGQVTAKSTTATISITDTTPGGVSVEVDGTGIAALKLDGKNGTTTFPAGSAGTLTDPTATTSLAMTTGTGIIAYTVLGQPVTVTVGPGSAASVTESRSGSSLVGLTVVQTAGTSGGVTVNGKTAGAGNLAVKSLAVSATSFALTATLTPGSGDAISPPEAIVLAVGGYSATIASGDLVSKKGSWTFAKTVGGVALTGTLSKSSGKSYQLQVSGAGANGVGTTNPITVALSIGDDTGVAVFKAKIT